MNALLPVLCAACIPLAAAPAQRLVAIDTNRTLVTLDARTGAATPFAVAGAAIGTPLGLAYDAAAGVLFVASSTQDALFTLDLGTGAATLVGSFGNAALTMHGLEYDSTNGQLYGCSSHDGGLYAIDRTTGLATLVGLGGVPGTLNLAHDSRTDTLYGTSTGGDSLYMVDRQTGAFTLVGNLQGSSNPQGFAYDPQLGVLWLVDNAADQLFAVDAATGRAHPVGSTGAGNNLLGLACIPGGTGSLQRDPHGCGPASILGHGRPVLGSGITVQLGNLTGVPFVGFGFGTMATPFCGCVLGHDWAAVVAGSQAVLDLPGDPALRGVQIGVQGLDLLGQGACASPQLGLTDTLRLTIG